MTDRIDRADADVGARSEKARRNRRSAIIALCFVAGLPIGFYIGYAVVGPGLDLSAPWPPAIAFGSLALYLAAILFGSIALARQMDEVETARQHKASAFAVAVMLTVYPAWFFLWKGEVLPEPVHWMMFVLLWLSLMAGSLYYRYR